MLDVVCFGEILWDLFETDARGREAIARSFRRELGGAPANVATGLARLGVRAAVVGGVGSDRFGEALVQHLRADGVDTRFVFRVKNRTGLTFVTRDARGEPEFLFYRHDSADMALRAADVTPAMGRARWALVGTSTLVHPELARATARFLDVARAAGASLFVDLNVRAHLWSSRAHMERAIARLVRSAAIVKASEADLSALAPTRAAGEAWLARHAPGATHVLTRGPGEATARGAHGEITVPARKARCVDATGAGDAFIAGSLAVLLAAGARPGAAAWTDGRAWRAALRAGHLMGRRCIARPGAVAGLVSLDDVRAAVAAVRIAP